MERNIDPLAKKGMRIHLTSMDTDDPNPIDSGLEGTIYKIDSLGTIHVNWDDGRILGVIPGIDEYYILPPTEDQIKPDEFMGMMSLWVCLVKVLVLKSLLQQKDYLKHQNQLKMLS
jgi:hypothetical protein